MAHDHDTGYKLLFSHPEMVRDLLVSTAKHLDGVCRSIGQIA